MLKFYVEVFFVFFFVMGKVLSGKLSCTWTDYVDVDIDRVDVEIDRVAVDKYEAMSIQISIMTVCRFNKFVVINSGNSEPNTSTTTIYLNVSVFATL